MKSESSEGAGIACAFCGKMVADATAEPAYCCGGCRAAAEMKAQQASKEPVAEEKKSCCSKKAEQSSAGAAEAAEQSGAGAAEAATPGGIACAFCGKMVADATAEPAYCCGGCRAAAEMKAQQTPKEPVAEEKKSCCSKKAEQSGAGVAEAAEQSGAGAAEVATPGGIACAFCGKMVADATAEPAYCCGGCKAAAELQASLGRQGAPAEATLRTVPCAHCGQPAVATDDGPAYCGEGCAQAAQKLSEAGLGAFYTQRAALGSAPSGRPVEALSEGRYAHYDSEDFQQRFTEVDGSIVLHVDGVHCAACVWVMEQLPAALPGVEFSRLDYGRARLHLRFDQTRVALSQVGEFLHGLGYATTASGITAEADRRRSDRKELIRLGVMGAVTGNTMMLAAALYSGADSGLNPTLARAFEWGSLGLALIAVLYGAQPFYKGAIAGLKLRVAHIDLPITLGLLTGFFASAWQTIWVGRVGGTDADHIYYDSVTALVFLLLVGRFVQTRGQRAALSRSELLTALVPGSTRRKRGDQWERVAVNELEVGDRVEVRAGETVPADGEVRAGVARLDQSLLTGESRPTRVEVGQKIFTGTRSVGEPFELEVLAVGTESRLGRLIENLEHHDAARAPVLQKVDRISGRFVIAVLTLAALGALGWSFVDPGRILPVVISLLVVTCPCALGLATPVALAVARGRAAASGVLVRSTAAIERLAQVERVWFDKTGTLTEGRMTLVEAALLDEADAPRLVALERRARHPVAAAIVRGLAQRAQGRPAPAVAQVEERAGQGLFGEVDGHSFALEQPQSFEDPTLQAALERALAAGHTPVRVRRDGQDVGLLALGDRLRPDALAAVERLRAAGVRVGILSGDHPAVVAAVAEKLQIKEAFGGLSPEQKAQHVQRVGDRAAMVGDGFNDAPALRAAHVGVAVHGGAEVALQVADLHLERAGAMPVVEAIEGAQRALNVVYRNLKFSLVYNLIFASLALAGVVSPLVAAIIMPLSSLTVIASSLLGKSFLARPAEAPQADAEGSAGAPSAAAA